MHGVGVPESVRRHRHTKGHAVRCRHLDRLTYPAAYRPVGDLPPTHLLRLSRSLAAPLQRNFQRGLHHRQLAQGLDVGQGNQTMRLTAAGIRPAVLAAFSARCLSVASCTNG